MEDQYVGQLTSDMKVCDVLGFKIGKIARIYRDESMVLQMAGAGVGDLDRRRQRSGILDIKTGPLGLGPHLYVPVTEIREVVDDSVFLDQNKVDVVREHRHKPEFLSELE